MTAFASWLCHHRTRAILAAASFLTLGACVTGSQPQPPCCYQGDVALAHVDEVYLALENGDRMAFDQAFPGYEPQTGPFTRSLPFDEVRIARVTFEALRPVLPQYDANGDGRIQKPELTVLYVREAAIGLGHDVNYVGTNARTDALVLPNQETGGLVRYVERNKSRMTPAAQNIFRSLVLVGQDDVLMERDRGPDREFMPN